MVRTLAGTLIQLGEGKLTQTDVKFILESKNRSLAKITAPGHALFLMQVYYDKKTHEFKLKNLPFHK
jgi:tRNA pseudouridine38-40 synthase